MSFTDIAPPRSSASAGTGIKLGLMVSAKTGIGTARLTFSPAAKVEAFGGPIAGARFVARCGRGQDEGRLMLVPDPAGPLVAVGGIKGTAAIRMATWDLLPKSPRRAEPVKIVDRVGESGVIFALPAWTRPSARGSGGKLDEEFGLKKAGG